MSLPAARSPRPPPPPRPARPRPWRFVWRPRGPRATAGAPVVGFEEISGRKTAFDMASNHVRILCGAQIYYCLQLFTLVKQLI